MSIGTQPSPGWIVRTPAHATVKVSTTTRATAIRTKITPEGCSWKHLGDKSRTMVPVLWERGSPSGDPRSGCEEGILTGRCCERVFVRSVVATTHRFDASDGYRTAWWSSRTEGGADAASHHPRRNSP